MRFILFLYSFLCLCYPLYLFADASMIQNKLAYDLAKNIGLSESPDCRYVDLWIDGEYQGNYLLCEKVEIGTNRVNLKNETAVLVEHDDAYYKDEPVYAYNDNFGYFTLKDNQSGDDSDLSGFQIFKERIKGLIDALNAHADMSTIKQYISVESFAKYYLVNEYLLNGESCFTSNYYYYLGDDGLIYNGPVWDFDSCMSSYYFPTSSNYFIFGNFIFNRLSYYPEYKSILKNLYETNRSLFENLSSTVQTTADTISVSVEMDNKRWDTFGKSTLKAHAFADTYSENVDYEKIWLDDRYSVFETDPADYRRKAQTYDGTDYYTVFDPVYYLRTNPDVAKVFGADNYTGALEHFIMCGMNEGRQGVPYFNVYAYQYRYADLRKAFGGNLKAYYLHYLSKGLKEGRSGSWPSYSGTGDAAEDGKVYTITPANAPLSCLDVSGGSVKNCANVQLYESNGSDAQRFLFREQNGVWKITCYKGGKCLDVSGGSKEDGANVWQYISNGTAAQQWILTRNANGSYSIISTLGKSLDISGAGISNGTNVQMWRTNVSKAQQFYLKKQDVPETLDGTYSITTALESSNVLETADGSGSAGANIRLGTSGRKNSKLFTVYHDGNGYYCLMNEGSGLIADVQGAGISDCTNIQQWNCNGSAAQQWTINQNSDGTVTFISACNGKAMDVAGGNPDSGTNVWCYTPNGTNAQKWYLN